MRKLRGGVVLVVELARYGLMCLMGISQSFGRLKIRCFWEGSVSNG